MPLAFTVQGPRALPAGPSYTGPGDLATFTNWWGLRGYSGTYAAPGNNPAIDVVDAATGLITTTVNILSNGNLDVATISGLGYAVKVSKMYDQTLNGNHLVQATLASMPALTLSAIGSLPGVTFASGTNLASVASMGSHGAPFAWSYVAKCTNVPFSTGVLILDNSFGSEVWYNNFTGQNDLALNSFDVTSVWLNAFHAIQIIYNGASSNIYWDSTSNPGSASAGTGAGQTIGTDFSGHDWSGVVCEIGWKNDGLSVGTDAPALDANQRAYWAF